MDLNIITKRLEEISKELPDAIKLLTKVEYPYNLKYLYVIQHSPQASVERREADAIRTCEVEGLYKPFIDAKVEVRTLQNEKECLIEMSRNIRSMRGSE